MKKYISLLLTMACLSLSATSFTSCSTTGGIGGVVSSAQGWLNDPKNQALISEIAQAANILIGAFGKHGATSTATVVGKLAVDYPNVPAGALEKIAQNPSKYMK